MLQIKVCPVQYRIKGQDKFRKGIQIINRKTSIIRLIDCKTMKDVTCSGGNLDYYVTLENSEGNIIFNLKNI